MTTTLLTARFDTGERQRLEAAIGPVDTAGFGVDGIVMPHEELLGRVSGLTRLLVEFEQIDEQVLDAAPDLTVVACCRNEPGASVDIEAATARGIPVLFTPGRNATAVAEYTLGLMIAATRGIASAHHALRHTDAFTAQPTGDADSRRDATAQWSLDPGAPFDTYQGPELSGRTLGIVGFGIIGREIARLGRAFGMSVLVYDPYVTPGALEQNDVRGVGLAELAARSDIVTVAAKVTPESRGVVSRTFFEAMRPNAYFVNTARAALVDYDALVDALRSRSIAGAALDVYPVEPLPSDSPLLSLDNVVLSPHLAGASTDVVRHHSRQLVDDILRIERGERPRFLANPGVYAAEATA
ncbi:2-hydroxyacid dehydrogenase [Compostimonas suwonensis]|uniref:D-3-phosphoglycerate dehydrogenase n=1 Tax=Compostimonas suwonensis TaxID=1048394 RepID=A0A2M9C3N3_9MICO|nr:2-hydroxyacid dehydrogenase [Compostimonas suwonensis]PJJ65151.1 D-3-phosphoglycerate dehydrogenase [Compostimonas suwonensis]